MILFPPAKINIGLSVLGKRDDGYHNIETVFYPVGLCDILEINLLKGDRNESVFTYTGLPIGGDPEKNLIVSAYRLLANDFSLPPVQVHLHKQIPMEAGLGGGSSDAAHMLKGLNQLFSIGLSETALHDYAYHLGSDCPFFISGTPAIGRGRGELLEPITLDMSNYTLFLVKPEISVSTREAYAAVTPRVGSPCDYRRLAELPLSQWKNLAVNDFEEPVFRRHPSVRAIKETLQAVGADYVSLTGSGSAVYAWFSRMPEELPAFPSCFTWKSLSK